MVMPPLPIPWPLSSSDNFMEIWALAHSFDSTQNRGGAGHCSECCPGDRSGDRTISGHDLCLSYPTPVSCPAPALTQNLLLARVNARFALIKWGPPAVSRHIIIHHIFIVQTTNLAFNDVDNEKSGVVNMQELAYVWSLVPSCLNNANIACGISSL